MTVQTTDSELKARHRKMWASGDDPTMVDTFLLPVGHLELHHLLPGGGAVRSGPRLCVPTGSRRETSTTTGPDGGTT